MRETRKYEYSYWTTAGQEERESARIEEELPGLYAEAHKLRDAVKLAGCMFVTKQSELPKIALKYMHYLCAQAGACGEVIITAFAYYGQFVLGYTCNNPLYKVTPDAREWFEKEVAE